MALNLIAAGEEMEARCEEGSTPALVAARAGHWEVFLRLRKAGARADVADDRGWSPLHYAARDGNLEALEAILEGPSDIEAEAREDGWGRAEEKMTPLSLAARNAKAGAIRRLLERGADPERANSRGETPLHHAASNEDWAGARELLSFGANIAARDASGRTPEEIARASGEDFARFLLACKEHADLAGRGGPPSEARERRAPKGI